MKARKLHQLVDAEITRRQMAEPILFRTLTIDFERRLVTLEGRGTYATDSACFTIPILSTEYPMVPGDWRPKDIN